jgi:hypothetical protein
MSTGSAASMTKLSKDDVEALTQTVSAADGPPPLSPDYIVSRLLAKLGDDAITRTAITYTRLNYYLAQCKSNIPDPDDPTLLIPSNIADDQLYFSVKIADGRSLVFEVAAFYEYMARVTPIVARIFRDHDFATKQADGTLGQYIEANEAALTAEVEAALKA